MPCLRFAPGASFGTGRVPCEKPAAFTAAASFLLTLLLTLGTSARAPSFALVRVDFPGVVRTRLGGINDVGQMVWTYRGTDGKERGFLYDGRSFTPVGFPGGSTTRPFDISDAGQVVGGLPLHPWEGREFSVQRRWLRP